MQETFFIFDLILYFCNRKSSLIGYANYSRILHPVYF